MKKINYFNHQIAYDVFGSGSPLVFLHGFGESRKMWRNYTPFFKQHKIITIDFPGAGDSDVMRASIARMAKIVNAVLVAEKIDQCILIGHSMGGYVTLAFAKLYAAKLKGYCLFHSQPDGDTIEKKAGRNKSIEFITKHGSQPYFRGLIPKLFATEFLKTNEVLVQSLVEEGSKMSKEGVTYQLEAMRDRPDNKQVLENSSIPVCFIIGKKDIAVPLENSLNQTHLPKRAVIEIFPEVGHMGMFEAPSETVGVIHEFIEFCDLD